MKTISKIKEKIGNTIADIRAYLAVERNFSAPIAIAGLVALTSGCGYSVVNEVSRSKLDAVSGRDAPYQVEVQNFYGSNYIPQKDERSALGYALLRVPENEKGLVTTLNQNKKTISISATPESTFLARQHKQPNGNPTRKIILKKDGKYGITANQPQLTELPIQTITNPDYDIETRKIMGNQTYNPYLSNSEKGKLNFLTIPLKGHSREIESDGTVSIINPQHVYEWINESIHEQEKQKQAESETKEPSKTEIIKTE